MKLPAGLSLAVCIAVFNRREKTLNCLAKLRSLELPERTSLTIYVLDDASTDGTPQEIRKHFPDVRLMESTGDTWWAGGMRIAYGAALKDRHDFYMWMNDDVDPFPTAILTLLNCYYERRAALSGEHIISGAVMDPETGRTSYGGAHLIYKFCPSRQRKAEPAAETPTQIDLVNGNMLLIPDAIADRLGNIPTAFIHTLADWDYGLRARQIGAHLWLAPGHVGYCAPNLPGRRRWLDKDMTLKQRYASMLHPLGLPFRPRLAFQVRHFPLVALVTVWLPYLKLLFTHAWIGMARSK